ncbi:MAG: TRAP transporter small permease [Rhodospirillales bacterium]|nr:TRAP transporter small permease [Rhodospirillales bacterium]
MRRFLDGLYALSGALAVFFLAAICIIVSLQVGANILDRVIGWLFGRPIGLLIPSYAEFAGFFLAATSFLALAHTFRKGSLIRVTLMIQRFKGRTRRAIELWCTGIAFLLSAFATVAIIGMVLETYEFKELATGLVPVPMWIPQLSMVFGMLILTIALADSFIIILKGNEPPYAAGEDDGTSVGYDAGSGQER